MMTWLKVLARTLLGTYAVYRVGLVQVRTPLKVPPELALVEVGEEELRASQDPELRDSAWYLGSQARGFACITEGRIVALACCWWGARYAGRESWPLAEDEAKLVHLVTLPAARGRGLAPLLIQYADSQMHAAGFRALYARVWFNNWASLQAFKRAGWRPVGYWVQVNPLRMKHPWRLRFAGRMIWPK